MGEVHERYGHPCFHGLHIIWEFSTGCMRFCLLGPIHKRGVNFYLYQYFFPTITNILSHVAPSVQRCSDLLLHPLSSASPTRLGLRHSAYFRSQRPIHSLLAPPRHTHMNRSPDRPAGRLAALCSCRLG